MTPTLEEIFPLETFSSGNFSSGKEPYQHFRQPPRDKGTEDGILAHVLGWWPNGYNLSQVQVKLPIHRLYGPVSEHLSL